MWCRGRCAERTLVKVIPHEKEQHEQHHCRLEKYQRVGQGTFRLSIRKSLLINECPPIHFVAGYP